MPADWTIRRCRTVLIIAAALILALKLRIASTTYGTQDITHWTDFAQGVRQHGPVGIYRITFPGSFYNHPPLIGYYLEGVNGLRDLGVPLKFAIRAVTSFADVASALLVFELLRVRTTRTRAFAAAAGCALSPLLVVVSGFHGNTDPILVLLVLLALYLLADRDQSLAAGVAMGLAIGVKIIPVVAVPALLIYALGRHVRSAVLFSTGFLAVFLLTWGPALLGAGRQVRADVLGYTGSGDRVWGMLELARLVGHPDALSWTYGSGRTVLVVICAVGPALLAWRRPERIAEAVGFALVGVLFLSPAFGMQYLVWAMAPGYLLSVEFASLYNLAAGSMAIKVYDRWAGGFPWNRATADAIRGNELVWGFVAWLFLAAAMIHAGRRIHRSDPVEAPNARELVER